MIQRPPIQWLDKDFPQERGMYRGRKCTSTLRHSHRESYIDIAFQLTKPLGKVWMQLTDLLNNRFYLSE
ncbi:hypothetical protein [[Eubacterium] cellulosolvens]